MDYKDFDYLKGLVRQVRAGSSPLTASMDGDVLTVSGDREDLNGRYRVSGEQRLRIVPVVEKVTVREVAVKAAPPPEWGEATCASCGAAFGRSRYNPYFDKCPSCRTTRKARAPGATDRAFVCVKCGKDFVVSKYHPYRTPEKCPNCTRNEGIHRRQKARDARRKALAKSAVQYVSGSQPLP
jgi:hypothetical protein